MAWPPLFAPHIERLYRKYALVTQPPIRMLSPSMWMKRVKEFKKWISIKLWLNTPMKKKHEEAKDWKYQKKQSSWKTALTSCSSCSTPFEDASQTTLPVFSSLSYNLFISGGGGGGHEEEEEVVVMVVVVAERGKLVVVIMLTTMIHRIKWIKNLKGANL